MSTFAVEFPPLLVDFSFLSGTTTFKFLGESSSINSPAPLTPGKPLFPDRRPVAYLHLRDRLQGGEYDAPLTRETLTICGDW